MHSKPLLILFTALFTACTASAMSADSLIKRHIDAAGGEAAHRNIQSISRDGEIETVENGVHHTYHYHTDLVYTQKLREQLQNDDVTLVDRAKNGDTYWTWNGESYVYHQDPDLMKMMDVTAEQANRDMLWVLDDAAQYRVMDKNPAWAEKNNACIENTNTAWVYCFDLESGLISAIGNDERHRFVSAWRRATPSNLQIPFYLRDVIQGEVSSIIMLYDAQANIEIPESRFEKPETP